MKLSELKAELLRILSQSISPDLPTPSSPEIHLKLNHVIKGNIYDVVDSKTGIVLSQCLIIDDTISPTAISSTAISSTAISSTAISPKGGE